MELQEAELRKGRWRRRRCAPCASAAPWPAWGPVRSPALSPVAVTEDLLALEICCSEQGACPDARLKNEYIGRRRIPVTDQLVNVCRIDIRNFGQCGRRKWRASILADQTGNVIPHPAFKNGDGFVLHRRATKTSPVKCVIMRAHSRGVNFLRTMARSSSSDARKLMAPAMIARIATQFHLPAERTEIQSGWPIRAQRRRTL